MALSAETLAFLEESRKFREETSDYLNGLRERRAAKACNTSLKHSGRRYQHRCLECGSDFQSARPHTKTCSGKCRTKLCRKEMLHQFAAPGGQ